MIPQEYLVAERAALDRNEFVNGERRLLAYGGARHSLLVVNLVGVIGRQLRGGPCRGYASNLRLHVPATGLYTYPDLSVIRGKARVVEDGMNDNLLNPTLLVEVVIPETEAWDRGEKFWHYQQIPTLREYVLVDRDQARVEVFTRRETPNQWDYLLADGSESVAILHSVVVNLPLAEIYDGVEFPPAAGLPSTVAV